MIKKRKSVAKAVPAKVLSDQEIVLQKFKSAKCKPVKTGFCVFNRDSPIHSGIAKSKDDAWKLAAHSVL